MKDLLVQEILKALPTTDDDAYQKYQKTIFKQIEERKKRVEEARKQGICLKLVKIKLLSKEEFIDKIKTDNGFYITTLDFIKAIPIEIEHEEQRLTCIDICFDGEYIEISTESERVWGRHKIKLIDCSYTLLGLILDKISQ